ncbi:MAG: hypothetical protein ACRDJ5_08535 [Actinomycetota bacterium]
MAIVIRRLPADGLQRFTEIDRSEEIHVHYRQVGEQLIEEAVSESVPDFFREGEHHSIPELVNTWQPVARPEELSWVHSTRTSSPGPRCSGKSSRPASFKSLCCT